MYFNGIQFQWTEWYFERGEIYFHGCTTCTTSDVADRLDSTMVACGSTSTKEEHGETVSTRGNWERCWTWFKTCSRNSPLAGLLWLMTRPPGWPCPCPPRPPAVHRTQPTAAARTAALLSPKAQFYPIHHLRPKKLTWLVHTSTHRWHSAQKIYHTHSTQLTARKEDITKLVFQ